MPSTSTDLEVWVPGRPQTKADPLPAIKLLRETDADPHVGTVSGVKGTLGEQAIVEFFAQYGMVGSTRITRTRQQVFRGDRWMPSTRAMECKSQPISPVEFDHQFIEVVKLMNDLDAVNPWEYLAAWSRMSMEQLREVLVTDRRRGPTCGVPLGGSPHMSPHGEPSLWSTSAAALTVYVNVPAGWLYVYRFGEVLEHVGEAIRVSGLVRGMGGSGPDTFGVLTRIPPIRFQRVEGRWLYDGDLDYAAMMGDLTDAWYGI